MHVRRHVHRHALTAMHAALLPRCSRHTPGAGPSTGKASPDGSAVPGGDVIMSPGAWPALEQVQRRCSGRCTCWKASFIGCAALVPYLGDAGEEQR